MKRFAGFTLIELLIVVAIVGIVAAIAYPSYLDYIRKSKRSDAMSGLLQVQLRQEKYRANNVTYGGTLASLGYAADPAASPEGIYNLNVVNASSTSYEVRAVPQGDQVKDICGTFAIGPDGPVSAAGYANADCWER